MSTDFPPPPAEGPLPAHFEPPAHTPPGPPEPPQPPGPPEPPPASSPVDDTRPQPGELHLTGRHAWKTWQLLVTVAIAIVVGMAINGAASSSATPAGSGSGSSGGTYKLPSEGGSGSTTTTTVASGKGGSASTTTTTTAGAAGASTTTTTAAGGAAGSTTTTQPLGQEAYLVPAHQSSGNWTSSAFTIAGSTWFIGWAFNCNPVPAAKPTFSVYVVTSGASASGTPAVTSSDAQGKSVTSETTTGSQQLVVQAPPQCDWVVKVTGYGGT